MAIQWSLVLFSLLAGTAGSLMAVVAVSEMSEGAKGTRLVATIMALILLAVGGCFSVTHLESPQNVIAAVTNLLSFSGISIELALLAVTGILALAYLLVTIRSSADKARKALSVLSGIAGLFLAYFCGHGYVIDAQPTWDSAALPFAYLGTCMVLASFLFFLASCARGNGDCEQPWAKSVVLVSAIVCAISSLAYCLHLSFSVQGYELLLWGGIVALGTVGLLIVAALWFAKGREPRYAIPLCSAGAVCSLVGGLSVRVIMWGSATGFLNLLVTTSGPIVFLN